MSGTNVLADLRKLRSKLSELVVIALYLLVRCQDTAGTTPAGANQKARAMLQRSAATQVLAGLSGRAKREDIVIVDDKLGLVVDVAKGKHGYESYLIRYLSKPYLPGIPEDWHRPQQVAKFMDAASIRVKLKTDQEQGVKVNEAAKLLSLSDKKLVEIWGAAMGQLWDAGVGFKEEVLSQVQVER